MSDHPIFISTARAHGAKWAFEVPSDRFPTNPTDLWIMLQDFMSFCNVVEHPIIERGLELA